MSGYTTTNLDMIGMLVTVTFAGGSTSSAAWTSAGASTSKFTLTETGDSYSDPFTLTDLFGQAITGFSLNGVPGNTTFDIITTPDDTPGSNQGLPFSTASTNQSTGLTAYVNYTNELIVGGKFYGDEYTEMNVTLSGAGLASSHALTFHTDTDNASASSPIVVAPPATPEPSSMVLLGTGIAAVGGAVRRRGSKS